MARTKWTYEKCKALVMEYQGQPFSVFRAKQRQCVDIIRYHKWLDLFDLLNTKHNEEWTLEKVKERSSVFTTKIAWLKGDRKSYAAALRNGWIAQCSEHMTPIKNKWTIITCIEDAKKFQHVTEWAKASPGAYDAASRLNCIKECTAHMVKLWEEKWNVESITEALLSCQSRTEFENKFPGAYDAARRLGIYESLKERLPLYTGTSLAEQEIFTLVKSKYSDALNKFQLQKNNVRREIDVYVPSLKRGVEFDGTYWHNLAAQDSNKTIQDRHNEKDLFFSTFGIQILHISEADWSTNKSLCIEKIFAFLLAPHNVANQKIIKDALGITEFTPATSYAKKSAAVREISKDMASDFILKYEWLQSMPAVALHCYGLFFEDNLAAVAVFSPEYSENLGTWDKYGYTGKIILLSRGATASWAPKWAASFLIARAVSSLPNKYQVITATVDPMAGEIGTIYQACNFVYVGAMRSAKHKNRMAIVFNGKIIGSRTIRNKIGTTKKEEILKHYPGAVFITQENKGRYFFFKGHKKTKEQLKRSIEHLIKPFPKRELTESGI